MIKRLSATLALALALGLAPTSAKQDGFGQEPARNQDDPPVIELNAEAVLVNLVVLKGGDYVDGLSAQDFEVAEDGVPQEIDSFFAEDAPFAAAILLDTSGSMEKKLRLARVAAARFMDRARPKDHVALYLFGSDVRQIQDYTPGGRDLDDSLWDADAEGSTKMFDCLAKAAESLATRPESRRAVLLISDGADSGSGVSYDGALRRALAGGVTIYTVDVAPIGASPGRSLEEMRARGVLNGLADRSGGRSFVSKGGPDLTAAFEQIVDELGKQYTISYTPTNTKRDGKWRAIDVKTRRPGLKVRARDGYTAPSA